MKIKPLTNWAITLPGFIAPELAQFRLYGYCQERGGEVRTGPIVSVLDDRTVITYSGSVYRLQGEPCKEFIEAGGRPEGHLDWVSKCLEAQNEES